MSSNQSSAPDEYFNDLSRQPESAPSYEASPPDQPENAMHGEEPGAPKPKRIACIICRKRKLKCDGNKPSCSTCARLKHNCAYDEVRRKSGPKRGYVKELEARLAQVETQLKTKALKKPTSNESRNLSSAPAETNSRSSPLDLGNSMPHGTSLHGSIDGIFEMISDNNNVSPPVNTNIDVGFDSPSWEMIGLGLEEPLPTQEAIDELHEVYFRQIHTSMPMIHKYRYRASMNLAPHMRPPVCLRYAMWCAAASVSEKYYNHQEIFYRRARKYAESDEMKGQGEAFVSVGHAQCWAILASYEFKMMYFPRAWMSAGRAVRLCQMMGLNRLDGLGLDVKQTIPSPRDWTDREERRRTFWMAYCIDRYASIGTGWPMTIDEKDIMTNLPASEEAYERSMPQETQSLKGSMTAREAASLSPFAGVVLMAYYFGKNLTHLHRPGPNEREDDLQGEFWKRHRSMDNALLNTALSLPSHLRLPMGVRNANVVFLNMSIHTLTICLHQSAIFKAENNDLPSSLVEQSQTRCLLAASEIATVMRLVSHLDVASMNPFIAFCLYVAARVFVQFQKKNPHDQEIRASLQFLLNSMHALKIKNPLSESFLIQLGLDLEGSGLDTLLHNADFSSSMMKGVCTVPADFDTVKCSPLLEIRDSRITQRTDSKFAKKLYGAFSEGNEMPANRSPYGGAQFSLQNMNLATREQRQAPQYWDQSSKGDTTNLDQLLPNGDGWNLNAQGTLLPNTVDLTIMFDMSMSDNTSDEQRSSHPTPSSHTSYSPPQMDDLDPNANTSHASNSRHASSNPGPTAKPASPAFFSFIPTDEIGFPPSTTPAHRANPATSNSNENNNNNNHESGDSFTVPQGWQLGSSGDTPDPLAEFSPGGVDSGWVHMMNGMMWDGSTMGREGVEWNGGGGGVGSTSRS